MSMLPHSKMTSHGKSRSKAICDGCGAERKVKGISQYKGKNLCFICRRRLPSARNNSSIAGLGQGTVPIEKVLAKTYKLGARITSKGNKTCSSLSFPVCMVDKPFKIVLVDEEEKE